MASLLSDIVGKENFSEDACTISVYCRSNSPILPEKTPEAIVIPHSVDEVQSIVLWANEHKIPLYPVSTFQSGQGDEIPMKGGVVVDLSRMRRILEVNRNEMYAVVEPGVTFIDLAREMKKYPDLAMSMISGQGTQSVLANYALQGCGSFGPKADDHGSQTLGVEVVLPNGQIVRTGSASIVNGKIINPGWYTRLMPGPDLTGLFIGSQGVLGIITKLALRLWPSKPFKTLFGAGFDDLTSSCKAAHELCQKDMVDSAFTYHWLMVAWKLERYPWDKFDGTKPLPSEYLKQWRARINFPQFYQMYLTEGWTDQEMTSRRSIAADVVKKYGGKIVDLPEKEREFRLGQITRGEPSRVGVAYITYRQGGMFCLTPYLPPLKIPDMAGMYWDIGQKHGFEIPFYFKTYRHGRVAHFGAWLAYKYPDEFQRARDCIDEMVRESVKAGAVFPRPAYLEYPYVMQNSSAFDLLKTLKKALDPNRIMCPDKFSL